MPPRDLVALQRWFQKSVMTGETRGAAREVLPSRTLSAKARLDVYAEMFVLRMHDALAADYPALRALIGEARFARLVRDYIARHPSRHPSLNFLGSKLPDFIARTRLPRVARDVARVELAMTEVFDERRSEPLDAAKWASVSPEAWAKARLRLSPALRLLALDYPANAIVTAARSEEPLPRVRPRKSWLAVYRKDYQVWRAELSREQFKLLTGLQRGVTLGRAIDASGVEDPSRVFAWFQEWRSEGFFVGVDLRKPRRTRPR